MDTPPPGPPPQNPPPHDPPRNRVSGAAVNGVRNTAAAVSSRLRSHREKVGPKEFVRQLTYWLLLPTAFYTTWHGMNDIVSFNYPRAGFVTVTITLLVSLMLFVLMNYTLAVWRSYDGLLARLASLAVYALTATLSVAFAFAFWWTVLSSRGRTAEDTQAGAAAIVRIANDARANLTSLQRSLEELARYSGERAQVEQTVGGTCGDGSGGQRGPRTRFREQDAASMASASTYMVAFVEGLTPALQQLETAASQVETEEFRSARDEQRRTTVNSVNAAIASVGQQVTLAKADERFLGFEKQFSDRIAVGRDGFVSAGQRYQCPDSNLEATLNAAISSIRNVQAIPDFASFRIPVIEGGEATMYAFDTFLNTGRVMLSGEPQDRLSAEAARQQVSAQGDRPVDQDEVLLDALSSRAPGVITGTQWFSFFLAVFIDVGIAFVGFGKPLNPADGLTGWLYGNRRGSRKAVRDWLNALQEMDGGLRSQVGPYHVTLLGHDYLVVPTQPELEPLNDRYPAAAYSIGHLAALLKAARLGEEVTPNNFTLKELHRRLSHNLAKQDVAALSPDSQTPVAADLDQKQPHIALRVAQNAWNRVSSLAIEAFADEEARDIRRRYRFFRTGRGVFDNLHLQSVARDMPEPSAG